LGGDDGKELIGFEAEQLRLLNFQRRDTFLQQRGALGGFCAVGDLEFVMFVRLVFGRFFTEQSSDGFTQRELGSGADRFPVGKTISAQIIDLHAQLPERGDAACQFIDGVRFGLAA
jgi:hypothetical protein